MKNPFYESIFHLRKERYEKDKKSLLTFLPGSRLSELKKTIPLFIDVVKKLNHEKFTFKFQGRRYRLTDVHGKVIQDILS